MKTLHYLDHSRGTIDDCMEGENWLDMLHGVFHESQQEIRRYSGYTGVCFMMKGADLSVHNMDDRAEVFLDRSNKGFELVERFVVLHPQDRVQIHFPNDEMIEKEIIFTYRKTETESDEE